MTSRPRRTSLSARRLDPPPTEEPACPDCSRPITEHSVYGVPDEGYVLHNDVLKVTCWKSLGRLTPDVLDALVRPGVLPPVARRPKEER